MHGKNVLFILFYALKVTLQIRSIAGSDEEGLLKYIYVDKERGSMSTPGAMNHTVLCLRIAKVN